MAPWDQFNMKNKKYILPAGFTLIELIVVIAIILVLSGVILFSISQYINKGKDSNIAGNLAILIPAGEIYYNANGNSYEGFCQSNIVKNAIMQIPKNTNGACSENAAGICCGVSSSFYDAWAACARMFSDSNSAFCVDSRGVKKEIDASDCQANIIECRNDPL